MKFLWEVLVPCEINGLEITQQYHQKWDAKIRSLTGGLTLYRPSKGQWISSQGTLHVERMIPVRILCSKKQLDKILDMTLNHYDQEGIFWYLVSKKVGVRTKQDDKKAFAKKRGRKIRKD